MKGLGCTFDYALYGLSLVNLRMLCAAIPSHVPKDRRGKGGKGPRLRMGDPASNDEAEALLKTFK